MKRTHLKRKKRLRLLGHSTPAELKREIQALLRQIAIKTYTTCVLSAYPDTRACAGPLQAEHLNSRQHARTFADMRNIVLLCQRHHIFWKPQNSRRYWELIQEVIGPDRWAWLKRMEADHTPYKADLKLEKIALQNELGTPTHPLAQG